ncbi:MAG: type VI secretion system lipoprotein TssJ [Myxococcales bacterium]|nr:type VI secretion system lipoprotein TssJ [Myxococcales bacterium]
MNARTTLVVILTLLSTACGAQARPSCDAQENAQLRVESTDRMNPDEDGRPLPTLVRIYQLASIGAMETASFEDIHANGEETLGDALLGVDEFTMFPETRISRQFERNPDANYIVGFAAVRRPTGVSWRTILELPPPAQEATCAALQEDPDSPPPEQPTVYVAFELDDYQIEGSIRLEYPPPPCDEGDLMCQAERAAAEAAEGVEAPEAPGAPEAPDAPQPDMPSPGSPPAP